MFNRSSRNHITILANDRVIKNNKIINAVTEGFKTYLPVGKYPIVLLKIDLDPLLIDVNIHPQKLEVKFTEERMLLSLITKTINEKLQTLSLIPKVKEEEKVEQNYKYEKLNLKDSPNENPSLVKEDFANYINNMVDKKIKQDIIDSYKTTEEIIEIKKLPELEYIGQLLGTYLIFQNEEGMYIMDQHAAAERVRYENYYNRMSSPQIDTYELLIPITLDLSNSEVFELKDKFNLFAPLGIKFEINTVQSIDITNVPTWFVEGYEGIYTEEIVRYVLEGKDITIGQVIDSLAKSLSCKHSIKANKYINQNEVKKLLLDLDNCVNPFTCPHGRPTVINFTITEIEKLFMRIM
jgi:DNA mismatch repair protein MutL